MEKDKKTPSIGIIVMVLLIVLGTIKSKNEPKTNSPAPDPTPSKKTLAQLERKINDIFSKTNPDSYTFFYDDNLAVLSVWDDNARRFIISAVPTNDNLKEWWAGNLEEIAKTSATMQSWFDDGGHPETTAVINYVSRDNHDDIYICASRGEIVYDVVADRSGNS